jgi:asparagine synthase (glutamine-hydrolysing)
MPGIVGLMTSMPREQAEAELLRMVEALRHESFYTTGTWKDEALGVYVGWVTRKDSCGDGMPLRTEHGNVVVFCGEDFGDGRAPQGLHVRDDAEDFFRRLNGRFHGVHTDRGRGTATLFNDRYGLHRIYYHASPRAFYFAAEAKAILEVRPELRRIDPRSLAEYIACGCVMEYRTLFSGIRVLPGAAAWTFRQSGLQRASSYFTPAEWETRAELEPNAFYEELRSVVSRVFSRYIGARDDIAVSLTGGLDTRMIMAWQRRAPGSLPCYTFGGPFRECHDVRVARQVAAACEQPHEVIPVGREFLARFPRYAERTIYLTDGCVEVCHAADLFLNERAREIAPIRLTGNYGGEVLRGVIAFKPQRPRPGLFQPELIAWARDAEGTFARALDRHPVSFAVFRQAPWYHYGLLALEQTQVEVRSPFLDNDLVATMFRAPRSALKSTDLCARLIADANPALARIRTDRGLGREDEGLIARGSHALIGIQRKAEYAYDYGMPQWLAGANRILSPLRLERVFLGWHKFCHFRVWYRGTLANYVREVLLDRRATSRPYIDGRALEAIVRDHVSGRRNYTTEIHKLLSLEIVHRQFIDA